jgi:hypothetical protein
MFEVMDEIKKGVLYILDNNLMYYVIVPLGTLVLGWLKSAYDIRKKNIEMGAGVKKYKRVKDFTDVAMRMYIRLAIICMLLIIMREIAYIFFNKKRVYITSIIIYVAMNILLLIWNHNKVLTRLEFLTDKKWKRMLIGSLCLVYFYAFLVVDIRAKTELVHTLIFAIILATWSVCLNKKCGVSFFIIDYGLADLHLKSGEKIEAALTETIQKRGKWITLKRYISDHEEEICVREDDVVRIEYYGEPAIGVKGRQK